MSSLSSSSAAPASRRPAARHGRTEDPTGRRHPRPVGVGDGALAHAEWNWHTRGESEIQRLDRNFLELLQELRVAQTGVQILFAFLLGIVFTPRFVDLDVWQRVIYVLTLTLAAGAAAILIAPVMYHRLVFRRRLKRRIVEMTHRHALIGLTLLLLSLVGALNLAVSLVIGGWAMLVCGLLAVFFVGIWFGLPLWHRRSL